jgi:hypothetical protein
LAKYKKNIQKKKSTLSLAKKKIFPLLIDHTPPPSKKNDGRRRTKTNVRQGKNENV